MTLYLPMDGSSDYIETPSLTIDKIVMVYYPHENPNNSSDQYYFGVNGEGLFYRASWGYTYISPSYTSTFPIINGVSNNSYNVYMPVQKNTVEININSITGNVFLSSQNQYGKRLKADIYDVKLYSSGNIVAHYDFSSSSNINGTTILDTSGNGNNATYYGGTPALINDATSSTTTYIGSGTATGQSNLTSNETLILSPTTYSENVDTTGFSSLATTDKLVENVSGLSNGQSSLNTSETKYYSANGNINSTSTVSHVDNVIYVDFGSSNGQSNLSTTETFVQHGTTTYSGNGQSSGLSSVSSNDKVTYESSSNVHGQSTLTTDEHESLSAQGNVTGISSAKSTEQIIGHATNSYSGMGLSDGTSNVTSSETKTYAATGHISGTSNSISHDNVVYFPIGIANGSTLFTTSDRYISKFQYMGSINLVGIRQLNIELTGTRVTDINLKGVI